MSTMPMDAEGRALAGLARTGTANLLGSGVSALCQLLIVLAVTRLYSANDAGALFAATSVFLIAVAIVEVGVDQGMVRFLAWHRARGDVSALRTIFRIGLLPVIGTSLLGGAILFAIASPLAGWLSSSATMADLLRVLAIAIPLAAMNDIVLAATRGYGVMRPTVIIERIIRPALQPIAIIAVGLAGGGLGALAAAWAGPYIVGTLLSALSLRRIQARRLFADATVASDEAALSAAISAVVPTETSGDRSLTRAFWSYTSARAVARICQVALQRMDVILVAALIGTRAAAVYTAATRFIAVGQLLSQAMQQVIQPRLAALLAVGEHRLAELVLKRTTLWLVALAWPGYLAIIALAPWLMSVFGPGYASGATTLVVLGIAMLAATAAGPLDVVLLMAGRSTPSLINVIVSLAVDIVGCLLLVPPLGVTGAAVAWAIAILVRNALAIVMTRRMLDMSAASHELAVVSGWALAYCAVVPVPVGLLGVNSAIVLPLVLLGATGYLATLWRRRESIGLLSLGPLRRGTAAEPAPGGGPSEPSGQNHATSFRSQRTSHRVLIFRRRSAAAVAPKVADESRPRSGPTIGEGELTA